MIYIWGPNGPTRSNISGITHTLVEAPPAQLLLIFKHTSPPLDSSQPSSSLFHMLLQVVLFCSVLFSECIWATDGSSTKTVNILRNRPVTETLAVYQLFQQNGCTWCPKTKCTHRLQKKIAFVH